MFGQIFGNNKVLVALWVYFQIIRESSIMTRYRETPQGQAEQARVSYQQQKDYIRRLRGEDSEMNRWMRIRQLQFWGLVTIVLGAVLFLMLSGCGDEGVKEQDLSPAEQQATELGNGIPIDPQTDLEAWASQERAGLKKQLADSIITQAQYAQLSAELEKQIQHERDRKLVIDFNISVENRGEGWQVHVVYGEPMTADDFQITIDGHWEIHNFVSEQNDDGAWDVSFFIATRSPRGLLFFKGLSDALELAGN